jgi:hypothetical protein
MGRFTDNFTHNKTLLYTKSTNLLHALLHGTMPLKAKAKAKLSLCLIKHPAFKMYGRVEI